MSKETKIQTACLLHHMADISVAVLEKISGEDVSSRLASKMSTAYKAVTADLYNQITKKASEEPDNATE